MKLTSSLFQLEQNAYLTKPNKKTKPQNYGCTHSVTLLPFFWCDHCAKFQIFSEYTDISSSQVSESPSWNHYYKEHIGYYVVENLKNIVQMSFAQAMGYISKTFSYT